MKKVLFTMLLLLACKLYAQTPQQVNYQAVIKDSSGNSITNTDIALQFVIHQGSASGTVVYTETQNVTTTDIGMVTLALGQGTTMDDFSTITWSTNTYFLKVGVDITGGTTYTTLGTQQLLSVPYALHSKTTEIGDNLGNHIATQDLNLANNNLIGTNTLTTGTIFSTAANATVNTMVPNGAEGIIMSGSTSDYIVSVQDGNGRVQHKWNASYGINETYIKGNEDAAFIDINGTASTNNDAWIEFKHADGASSNAGDPISWNTQLIINQGGEVGINETSPDDMLHISSGGNGTRVRTENTGNGWAGIVSKNSVREIFVGVQGAFDANPGEFHIYDNTAGARRFVIDAAGEVGIGRNNPSVKLDVNGSVNCTGGTCSSDERWKKNIRTLPNVIENIKQMRGVSYFWKTEDFPDQNFTSDKQIGLIAQEVEKVYPELVKTNEEGYKSMDYMSLTAVLLEAVKEQQNEIEDLKAINGIKSKENKALEARLSKIEALLNMKPNIAIIENNND
ncbi:tail fiber domain-containing protein [uncultured Lacinutrix sp.]|uniref:tail fiber domain-containing protein n=1 Tax=uncultured Lacinutrix sp. TaxID=574032 RepID=UPI002617448A|nr:tail fiber domain-containing protein [uncultured Lacinutrix sp.]